MMRDSALANAPRMSLSALNQNDNSDRQVRIWLLGAVTVKGTVFYRIAGRFTSSGQTWELKRRYSEFLVLRDTLIKFFSRSPDTCPGCLNYLHSIKQFDFPKKHVFVSKSQIVINYRVQALRSFMNLLASWAFSNSPKCPTCGGFAFDIVRNFCLESAEPVGESNMSYIRDSFVVSTFTDPGRRSSIGRRNSFTPSPGGHSMGPQRASDANHRNTISGPRPQQRREQDDEDAYEAFNNYLVAQPTHQSKAAQSRSTINVPQNRPDRPRTNSAEARGKHPQQGASANSSSVSGSFLFYQDGVERGNSSSTASSHRGNGTSTASSQRTPSSSGGRRGILKNRNDVRNDRDPSDNYSSHGAGSGASGEAQHASRYNQPQKTRNDSRSQNDSYFSLGASSDHSREDNEYKPQTRNGGQPKQRPDDHLRDVRYDRSQNDSYLSLGASSTSGDLEDEYHSHHPSVMPSPINREDRYAYQRDSSRNHDPRSPLGSQRHGQRQAPVDESFASDVDTSLRFDGMAPVAVDDASDSDDDEIDVTGLTINPKQPPRKSTSGQNLWQPWELAKAG